MREQQRKELTAVDTELAKTEAGIERYMDSFESGGVKEDTLVKRIRDLGERAADLRTRRAALRRPWRMRRHGTATGTSRCRTPRP
jgi:hypothetical protein